MSRFGASAHGPHQILTVEGWKPRKCFAAFVAITIFFFATGCQSQEDGPRTSHFEHDHEVAAHWPSDLADAARKIRDRLGWLETGEIPDQVQREQFPSDHEDHEHEDHEHEGHDHGTHDPEGHDHEDHDHEDDEPNPAAEIADLVSWVPEVAADTDLAETDWLPLYHASESLSANLRSSRGEITDANRTKLKSFCELIEDAARKIPKPMPDSDGDTQ